MAYVIDSKQRLRLPRFKPGETWNEQWQDENHVLLEKLVPPPEPEIKVAKLVREKSGVPCVVRSEASHCSKGHRVERAPWETSLGGRTNDILVS